MFDQQEQQQQMEQLPQQGQVLMSPEAKAYDDIVGSMMDQIMGRMVPKKKAAAKNKVEDDKEEKEDVEKTSMVQPPEEKPRGTRAGHDECDCNAWRRNH
jgi:hypothetical protein